MGPRMTGARDHGSAIGEVHRARLPVEPAHPAAPAEATLVEDVMTLQVFVLRPELSLESATWLLLDRGLSGAPVVDPDEKLVGFLSMTDLVRRGLEEGETHEEVTAHVLPEMGPGHFATQIARSTVGEVMSTRVLALPASCTLPKAAALMAYEGLHRAPVVLPDRVLVGILSSLDVLAWLGRGGGYTLPGYAGDRRTPPPPTRVADQAE